MKTVARIELDEARSRAERVAGASCPADLNPDPRKFV
jgi:hypothetical protein